MLSCLNRRKRFVLLTGIAVVAIGAVGFFFFHRPPDIRESLAVRRKWLAAAENGDELTKEGLAAQCLEISRKDPGTVGGLLALQMAAARAPNTVSGRQAQQEFAKQVETADIDRLAQALDLGLGPWEPLAEAAPAMLARARQFTDHAQGGRLLAAVCVATRPQDGEEPSVIYVEAGDLIADKFAASPEIGHFCESLFSADYSPPWAVRFEPHLLAILAVNQDRAVRCTSQSALATIVHAQEDRQAEAQELFEQFCSEFDGKHQYRFQGIEQTLFSWANSQLDELRFRAAGMPAPEIAGIDLADQPMTLSEHRGKVVLLNFWATWCGPWMKLIPHERELAVQFHDQPFVIVGVNSDDDVEAAREAVARNQVTWRSFRDTNGDKPAISNEWKIIGYPSVFLIDHHGTIRKRWIESPSPEELAHMVGVLVDAARRNLPPHEMKPIVAALPLAAQPEAVAEERQVSSPQRTDTRFLDKVYRAPDGSESGYVLFVPHTYDGSEPLPAIVFLHGAGSRGSDSRLPARGGLAKAIRERIEGFPFLVIFPQAREGENWTAESTAGKRALAILDKVQEEYRIDADRISLTGLSMGGQGTWSLAAADPERWAAIVPICHGWRTDLAAKLKNLPCWCFHGDADEVIPAQQSREMILAIKAAGGRPLYTEFSGVGHEACADRAYVMPDLWEWLLLQNRAER
ncbi:MAG: redoxin family protein [Pirellulales bacterium]